MLKDWFYPKKSTTWLQQNIVVDLSKFVRGWSCTVRDKYQGNFAINNWPYNHLGSFKFIRLRILYLNLKYEMRKGSKKGWILFRQNLTKWDLAKWNLTEWYNYPITIYFIWSNENSFEELLKSFAPLQFLGTICCALDWANITRLIRWPDASPILFIILFYQKIKSNKPI